MTATTLQYLFGLTMLLGLTTPLVLVWMGNKATQTQLARIAAEPAYPAVIKQFMGRSANIVLFEVQTPLGSEIRQRMVFRTSDLVARGLRSRHQSAGKIVA
jgi:hypothetical protein